MLRKTLFGVLVLLLFLTVVQPALAEDEVSANGFLLQEILRYVYENHLDSPDLDNLVQGAVDGMLGSLGDPYTEYFTQDNLEQFNETLDGDFVGVGVSLLMKDNFPYVAEVFTDSPALKAGLQAGDIIVMVDGKNVEGLSLVEVVHMIRGPEGTTVALTVLRQDVRETFRVKRGTVNAPTVSYEMFEGKTGYITINTFGSHTAEEFAMALNKLRASGMQSLIIDLRNNPGGYLLDAVEIAGHFIPSDEPVVTVVDRSGRRDIYRAGGKAEAGGIPIAVLVNKYSASASEVLAGALRDYKLAVLVGEQTYGKGVVQSVIPLLEGGALKLTVAKYLTPQGHDLNLVGLKPDTTVLIPGLQLPVARQLINPPQVRLTEFNVGSQEILVNGEKIVHENVPFIEDEQVYIPLRLALESLSFEVGWEESGEYGSGIIITGYNNKLFIPHGKGQARLNGQEIDLSVGLLIKDGVSYIAPEDLEVLNIQIAVNNGNIRLQN